MDLNAGVSIVQDSSYLRNDGFTRGITGTDPSRSSPFGSHLDFGGSDDVCDLDTKSQRAIDAAVTDAVSILALFQSSSGSGVVAGKRDGAVGNTEFQLAITTSGINWRIGSTSATLTSALTFNEWNLVGISHAEGSATAYVDGEERSTSSSYGAIPSQDTNVSFAAAWNGYPTTQIPLPDGKIALVAIWLRKLTSLEQFQLAQNPFQMFEDEMQQTLLFVQAIGGFGFVGGGFLDKGFGHVGGGFTG